MPITAFKRYELKFKLTKSQLDKLLPVLSEYMNSDEYCKDGKTYSIYNIYYDTKDNNLIRESLNKPYHKEKLRLRSYNCPITDSDKVFLELKKKTGSIVHKRRAVMTLYEAEEFIDNRKAPELESYMNRQVVQELEYFLSNNKVFPAVFLSYNRMAFFGKDDKSFRVTFDSDIIARRENCTFRKENIGENILPCNQYIMEIKITSSMPIWLADILSELNIYKTNFSKYGTEYKQMCQRKVKSTSDYNSNTVILCTHQCTNRLESKK